MALISVVVPVYNKIKSLDRSLASLFQQTFRDYEVIAVDDGSTDGSLELLQKYVHQGRLQLLQRQEPGPGGYAARNLGAEHATASWLVFFDADDMLVFDHLSRFAEAVATYQDTELFVQAYQKMDGQRRLPKGGKLTKGVLTRCQALRAFSRWDFIHMNGVCMKRERFLELGGFPVGRFRRGGDVYFWLHALCELEKIHYDDTVTSLWMLEYSSVTRDIKNLVNVHPAADLVHEMEGRLTFRESCYLKAAVNRKIISWAIEKKQLGHSVKPDIAALSVMGFRLRLLLHALTLMMPQPCFNRLRAWVKA